MFPFTETFPPEIAIFASLREIPARFEMILSSLSKKTFLLSAVLDFNGDKL